MTIKAKKKIFCLRYGLQRSGTNFLKTFIEKNFHIKFEDGSYRNQTSPGNKHARFYANSIWAPKSILYKFKFHTVVLFNLLLRNTAASGETGQNEVGKSFMEKDSNKRFLVKTRSVLLNVLRACL